VAYLLVASTKSVHYLFHHSTTTKIIRTPLFTLIQEDIWYVACIVYVLIILLMSLTFRLQGDGMLFGAKRFHQR
jgi:hypothetical protein